MMRTFIVSALVFLMSSMAFFATSQESLQEGQIWETPVDGFGNLVSLVQKIEPYGESNVIHITTIEYDSTTENMFVVVEHLPFEELAFRESTTRLLGQIDPDPNIYVEGYTIWKKDEGGIFTLNLDQVINELFSSAVAEDAKNTGKGD